MTRDPDPLTLLLGRQESVVSRQQLLRLGITPKWAGRRLRDGRWQRLHPGVYVAHSGPVGWRTRARAALLHAGPDAAVSHATAGHLWGFLAEAPRRVEISVPAWSSVDGGPWLRVHRRRAVPPALGMLRVTDRGPTVVDLVDRMTSQDDVVALVCAAVRAHVRPEEIRAAEAERGRLRHRALLLEVVEETAGGIESPLERRYHHDVERRHALPRSTRQKQERVGGRWIRADCVYDGLGVRTELDGGLAHPGGRTDEDTWRDNAVLVQLAELTLRYRWRHVAGRPCAVAAQVAAALRSNGWQGRPRPCRAGCPVT